MLEPGDIVRITKLGYEISSHYSMVSVVTTRVPGMNGVGWTVKVKNHFRKLTQTELPLWKLRLPNLK